MKHDTFYVTKADPSVYEPYPVIEGYGHSLFANRLFANHLKVVRPYMHELKNWYSDCTLRYVKELASLESYLKSKGKILPKDVEQFLEWFFTIRHSDWYAGLPIPRVEDTDFLLFSAYRETELEAKLANLPSKELLIDTSDSDQSTSNRTNLKKEKGLKAYALMHAILCACDLETPISRENGQAYAYKYGSEDGETMYQRYNLFSTRSKRTNSSGPVKNKRKKAIFEQAIELLKDHPRALERAKEEYSLFLKAAHEDAND